MKSFRINDRIEIVCQSQKTRYGFRHLATLLIDGREQETAKCCYYNRTWERWEFQTVLIKVVNKAFENKTISREEREACMKFAEGDQTDWSAFKMVSAVAKMGEVLCDNKKEKNDWKARMLKAGLEPQGFQMPEDWESLDENEKEKRLNAVLEVIKK